MLWHPGIGYWTRVIKPTDMENLYLAEYLMIVEFVEANSPEEDD